MARDKMRKAYQRQFNKKIRAMNKGIENDELWQGRFIFHQWNARWWKFDDNSGGELIAFIRAYDKLTGYYHDYRCEYAPWHPTFDWHLTMDIGNKFIVEDANVWKYDRVVPSLKNAINYTKVKVNIEDLMQKPVNWYYDYENFYKLTK